MSSETIRPNKPTPEQELRENLQEKWKSFPLRAAELTKELEALPDPLPDAELENATELFKSVNSHLRKIETTRQAEKEPILALERTLDAFFKNIAEPLEDVAKKAKPRYDSALNWRAETKRKAEEAAALERQRIAAEEKRRAEEEAEKKRLEAKRAADEAARLEAERLAEAARRRELEERARAPATPPPQPDAPELALEPEKPAPKPMSPAELLDARLEQEERDRIAALAARKATATAEDAKRIAMQADAAAQRAQGHAKQADAHSHRVTNAPSSTFARVRTQHGALATQRDKEDFIIKDRKKLPMKLLWPFLSTDAIDAAVKAAVKAGVTEIKGVEIFKSKTGMIR